MVLLCFLGQGLEQFSPSIFRNFHSLHLHLDDFQSHGMKYLLATKLMKEIMSRISYKVLVKHTPAASDDTGKSPHCIDETSSRQEWKNQDV